jgi:hypothetical protein
MHIIKLIPDDKPTPPATPDIALLEAVGTRDDMGFAVLGCGKEERVVEGGVFFAAAQPRSPIGGGLFVFAFRG